MDSVMILLILRHLAKGPQHQHQENTYSHTLLPLVNGSWGLKSSFLGNVSSLTVSRRELCSWATHLDKDFHLHIRPHPGGLLWEWHIVCQGAHYFGPKTGFHKNPTSERTGLTTIDDQWNEPNPSMWNTSCQIHSNTSQHCVTTGTTWCNQTASPPPDLEPIIPWVHHQLNGTSSKIRCFDAPCLSVVIVCLQILRDYREHNLQTATEKKRLVIW